MKDLNNILEECSIHDIYFSKREASILYKIQRKINSKMYLIENKEVTLLCKLNR